MSDSKPTFGLLVPSQISSIQAMFVSMTVQGLLMGIVFLLALMATYTLFRQGFRGSIARQALQTAISVACLSCLVVFASTLATDLNSMTWLGANPVPATFISKLSIGMIIGSRINYLLSDLIVVWRAWVLSEIRVYQTVLAICTLAVIGCDIAETVLSVKGSFSNPSAGKERLLDLLLFVPLLVTNVLATSIIAHKTWGYRKVIKVYLHQQSRQTRVEKILVLLIESGLVYCAFWVVMLLAALGYFSHMATDIIGSFATYTAAIYPMTIILLVSYGNTNDSTSLGAVPTQSIRFADSPHRDVSRKTHSIIQSLADQLRFDISDEETSIESAGLSGTKFGTVPSKELGRSEKT